MLNFELMINPYRHYDSNCLEHILKDLEGILGRHGVQRIDATGQQFDPHFHQAVFEHETDEHTPGTVVQVMQDGYKIQDRLLRPAMVSVAKAKQQGVA